MVCCAIARALHAGMAEWLCQRAETLGFRYPTAVGRCRLTLSNPC
jgi:hypothetical protein